MEYWERSVPPKEARALLRFEFSIEVDRPPSEVFVYITDAGRLPEWQSDVVEAEWQSEPGQGARIREVRRFLGRRLEIEQEVTDYEPGRRLPRASERVEYTRGRIFAPDLSRRCRAKTEAPVT